MAYKTLIIERQDGVATITLNRPETLNAISPELVADLVSAMEETGGNEEVRAVILTGSGRAFCAGGDIKDMSTQKIDPMSMLAAARYGDTAISAMRNLPKPIIAAVNGPAAGGGLSLALACDIRIASEDAIFSSAFITLGFHPDFGGVYLLTRAVGTARACELLFTGKMIKAGEAERIGLINQVVPSQDLMSTVRALAVRLAKGPTKAIGMAKSTIYQAADMDMAAVLEIEAKSFGLCFATEDANEGVKAFMEKRKPVFKGK